ncbi:effector binding domain-containing protein [Oceanobacillus sp. FSL W8-0428]|uniref:effector binding domain-containing protein n=1 Tax=Oceanobacillus TaxID=182709 RepID=UPI0030DAC7C1
MQIKQKDAGQFIGRSIEIAGKGIHDEKYSQEKTAFYQELFKLGMMKELMPVSKDKKGYALIIPIENGIRYFAGILSDVYIEGYEKLEITSQSYVVLAAQDGISRNLFDQLEDTFFTDKEKSVQYNGKEVLEVLLNGNPANAEVELWVPVTNE